MTDTLEQQKQLEMLLLSEYFEELNLKTRHFNIFDALKLQNAEIRHSNFLGWLMAPYETHDLGDYFLKEFLKSAIKDFSLDEKTELCLSDIALKSFVNAEIRREYKNIDILVIDNDNNIVCVVENKTWTDEHDNQLVKYAKEVYKEFPNYKKLFIFLTPQKEKVDYGNLIKRDEFDDDKKKIVATYYYVPMNYEQVFYAIDKTLRFNNKRLNSDVKTFIEHYKNMIKRDFMGITDKEIVTLCRKIYREHKKAIDLINENNDFKAELIETLQEVIEKREDLDFILSEDNCILCLPKNINNIDKLKFADWKPDDIVIHIQFVGNFRWKNCLYVEIAVTGKLTDNVEKNKQKRQDLIECVINKLQFNKFNGDDNWAYTPYRKVIDSNEFYKCADNEELQKLLNSKIDDIKAIYIDGLRDVLNEFCLKEF